MNWQFLVAAILTVAGGSLHFYTFEVWIWPKLKPEDFPSFPFGDSYAVMTFYRIVWHFFTVVFVITAGSLFIMTFTLAVKDPAFLARFLSLFWIGNVLVSLIIPYLGLRPGDSYIKGLIKAFQWVVMLIIVALMWWGSTRY
jgi:hypothetical protein